MKQISNVDAATRRGRYGVCRLPALILLATVWANGQGDEVVPLTPPHGNPFLQIFGLPAPERTVLPPAGGIRAGIGFTQTNNADAAREAGEFIVLDGESYRLNFALRYGLSGDWSIGIDLPLVHQAGGFLDSPIREWHSLLGVSNDNRAGEDDRLSFVYERDGVRRFETTGPSTGIGDVQLSAQRRVASPWQADNPLVVSFSVKLPSGDAAKLHGSGATDVAVAAHWSRIAAGGRYSPDVYLRGGVLLPGDSDVFGGATNDAVAFGTAALRWQATTRLAALVQLDLQSAYIDSELDELGGATVQLGVGGRVRTGADASLDLAIIEDLVGDATPDVSFHIAWSGNF